MSGKISSAVVQGGRVGTEVMEASIHIIQECGARFGIETIEVREKVDLPGNSVGVATVGITSRRHDLLQGICIPRGDRCRLKAPGKRVSQVLTVGMHQQ